MQKEKETTPIEQVLVEAATKSILKLFGEGSLIAPDYANRMKVPADLIERIYGLIDYEKVVAILGEKINEQVAVKITHLMTEELTNDVKKALCHQPTRERLRGVVAAELEKIRSEQRDTLPAVTAAQAARRS
jgi:hypothetical protein